MLFKIGFLENPTCSFCKQHTETYHFLYYCTISNNFWKKVESTILSDFNWARCLSLKDVIVGIENEKMDVINYIIILEKTLYT